MKKYWSQRPPAAGKRRFHVKVKPLKLEGFCKDDGGDGIDQSMAIQMKWNTPKSVFVPFYRSKPNKNSTCQKIVENGDLSIEWDDEFERICDFSVVSTDGSLYPWHVSFCVLQGQRAESKSNKKAIWGRASFDLAETATNMESEVQRKLPVNSVVDGVATAGATLSVSVSFAEVRNSNESLSVGVVQSSTAESSEKGDAFLKKMMSFTGYKKMQKKKNKSNQQESSCESEDASDTDGSSGATNENGNTEVSSGAESETQADPVRKDGLLSWKRRRLSFRRSKKKEEPSIKKSSDDQVNGDVGTIVGRQLNSFSSVDFSQSSAGRNAEASESGSGNWEMRELISRDGQTKLTANVFFASFDQRSEKAAGEGACTALVAVMAHWLHWNQDSMPTKQEYDKLITQGSSDWRVLCNNEAYTNLFPDKHFDLETVLEAGIHPITVLPDKSFTGFFSPEKFEPLRGAMSFDAIWSEINRNSEDCQPADAVYIVSWNDHFFVLKVEANAYYIMDSLGERLFEGCNQAYILKFDDSSFMYGKVPEDEAASVESAKAEEEKTADCKEEVSEEMISNGEVSKEEACFEESSNAQEEKADCCEEESRSSGEVPKAEVNPTESPKIAEEKPASCKTEESEAMISSGQVPEASSEELVKVEEAKAASCNKGGEELICSGRECCKEYIKRFLAAIPLGELEVEEKKGTVSTICLHKRLQIDFHYSSSSSSATTSSSSSPALSSNLSLFSSEESN